MTQNWVVLMLWDVRVTVEGLPEEIQRVADALDTSFPGRLIWHQAGVNGVNNTITVCAEGMPVTVLADPAALTVAVANAISAGSRTAGQF